MSAPPKSARSAPFVPWRTIAIATLLSALALACAPAVAGASGKSARALAYFDRGASLYKQGKFREAAPLFLRAWSTHAVPDYLFNAARAEHRSGQISAARDHYRVCLGLKQVNKTIRERAKIHIEEIEIRLAAEAKARLAQDEAAKAAAERAAAEAQRRPAAPPLTTEPPQVRETDATSGSWLRPVGWVAVGGGLLVGGLGAWLLVDHGAGQAALDDQLTQQNQAGLITGIDHRSYTREQDRLHRRRRLAVGSLAAAGTLAVVGGWMLWTTPDVTAAVQLSDGLSVAFRARF